MARDIYQEITDKVLKMMETSGADWVKPWQTATHQGAPKNAKTGLKYTGINVFNFWIDQQEFGYESNVWATYKQWAELGAQVQKGQKAHYGLYFNTYDKEVVNPTSGDTETEKRAFAKAFAVFNADQVDGYEVEKTQVVLEPRERHEAAEKFIKNTGAFVQHGGDRAYYSPSHDFVQMPELERFIDSESYYGTILHELTHWTKHKTRLDRQFGGKRFGDDGYAMEELVAELGAALLCVSLQVTPEPRDDHAKYLNNWLQALKNDKRYFMTAASAAQKAANFLEGLQASDEAAA